jgi:Domain of unknown function (DUF4129)
MKSSQFIIQKILTAAFCMLVFAVSVFAVNVADYRKSVANSIAEFDSILYIHEEDLSENQRNAAIRTSLQKIRNDFLKVEKVEINNVSVEVDNTWLKETLAELDKTDIEINDFDTLITEATNKLTTLDSKLDEVEKQTIGSRSKNEDKQKLEEILSRNDYRKAVEEKEKEKSWLQEQLDAFWKALEEWLKGILPQNPAIPTPSSDSMSSLSLVLQVLIVAIAIGIVGFVIYRFAPFLFGIKRSKKKERKTRVILGETILADQDSTDILSDADLLAQNGDLRGAIRKGYIALLCELSDRKIIGLAQHKTNRDYLRDVRKDQPLHQNMNVLTNSFERHWYGFLDAEEQDWQDFRARYRDAVGRK